MEENKMRNKEQPTKNNNETKENNALHDSKAEQDQAALLKQMVDIVKECKDNYEGDLGGDLYIRGNLPKQKTKQAVEFLTKLLPEADPIEENEIVALFNSYGGGQYKCFSLLLFTVKGFYYDVGGRYCNPCFVHWHTLWDIRRRLNRKTKIRKQITFCFHDGDREGSIFMPARYVHSVNHFLMPVLHRLSNSVEKCEEDKELEEAFNSPTFRILGIRKASDLLKFKGEDEEDE